MTKGTAKEAQEKDAKVTKHTKSKVTKRTNSKVTKRTNSKVTKRKNSKVTKRKKLETEGIKRDTRATKRWFSIFLHDDRTHVMHLGKHMHKRESEFNCPNTLK